MDRILRVFKRDVRAIIKNPVAILIVLGITFIPSLYAWVNIRAAWDPYENTSTIPIAVVNNDKGTKVNGKKLNMGDEVVKKLEDNDRIGWKFVDSKQADIGVIDGTYYAVIEIPKDFSKNLTSLISNKPKKAEIIYKVDTKSNPVSGKIAGVAESTLVQEIQTNFVATVNEIVFSSLNQVGEKLQKNKDNIIKLKKAIVLLDENMGTVLNVLGDISDNSENLNMYLIGMKDTLPSLTKNLENMQLDIKNASELAGTTKESFGSSLDNLELNLNNIKDSNDRIRITLAGIRDNRNEHTTSAVGNSINSIRENIQVMKKNIETVLKYLKAINSKINNQSIDKLITSLNNINSKLDEELNNLNNLETNLQNDNANLQNDIDSINNISSEIGNEITSSIGMYNSNVKKDINNIFGNFVNFTKEATSILESSKGTVKKINTIVNSAIDGTKLTSETANHLRITLEEFKGEINLMSKKLKGVDDDNLSEILSLLQSNPELMGENLSAPFEVKNESIYKIPNYGSGMTPIYSVLAIWVGGLVLTSVLKTRVPNFEGGEDLTIREKYLGKMILFVILGAMQALIIVLGNILLLGVYTVAPILLVAFGLVTGIVFTIIIYTLVSMLGNLGKALSIILLVLQLAGSGGTYPIQVDPLFFRIIQPFFPFTYALSGFREAIGGPLWSRVVLDFAILILMGGFFLIIGIMFKEKLDRKVNKFEEEFEKSGIAE